MNAVTKKLSLFALAVAISGPLTLGGCTTTEGNQNQTVGTILGGVAGAVAGSQFGGGKGQLAATAAGALLGAYVGSQIGASMDEVDRMKAQQAQQQAYGAPMNQTIAWSNPNNGHAGTITPVNEGVAQGGEYCREFDTTVTIDGRMEQAKGTACRQADGSWKIVN